jgi:hypothetical protein
MGKEFDETNSANNSRYQLKAMMGLESMLNSPWCKSGFERARL